MKIQNSQKLARSWPLKKEIDRDTEKKRARDRWMQQEERNC